MHQARFFICVAIAAGAAALALQAGVREADKPQVRLYPVPDVDRDPIQINPEAIAGTGGDPGCLAIGGTTNVFNGSAQSDNLMRGDVLRITKTVTLSELVMRLTVPTPTPLHVGVYRRLTTATTSPWARVPNAEAEEIVIPVPEEGPLAFQRTGPLDPPIVLEAGYDYLVAYAWDGVTVSFGRDTLIYPGGTPVDMTFGQVRGSFGLINTLSDEGSLPPTLPTTVNVFANGAYAMQLCVGGACCYTSGLTPRCTEVSREQCNGLFGQFTGVGITCADIETAGEMCPVPNGSCCLVTDSCTYTNEFSCEARGGESWREGLFCNSDQVRFCAPRGACCFHGGTCQEDMFENDCEDLGGFWRGEGVACSGACAAGACCFGNQCDVIPEGKCLGGGGRFLGNGVACAADSCVRRGACCNPSSGVCTDNLTQTQCTGVAGRVYRGDDTICSALSPGCGKGACCTPGAGCQDAGGDGLTSSQCTSLSGTFRGDGTSCFGLQEQCPGTCCFGLGFDACSAVSTPDTCRVTAGGGLFVGYNKPCPANDEDPDPCAAVTTLGGCCMPTGECVNMGGVVGTGTQLQQICTSQMSGTWIAGNQGCAGGACAAIGACCDGSVCEDGFTEDECMAIQGSWDQGNLCESLNPPCEATGACCNRAALSCDDDVRESQCTGEFYADLRCTELDEPCEDTGACCVPGEGCLDNQTILQCFTAEGVYQGDNVACGPESCIPRGACCEGTVCTDRTEAACGTAQGQYLGDGSLCGADTCFPKGACCVGAACSFVTQTACGNASGEYLGDDVACSVDSCVVLGACCVDGFCANEPEDVCTDTGGTYAGDKTTCTPNLCTAGACCLPDCTCDDDVQTMPNGAACVAQNGQFISQASCASAGCSQGIVSSDPASCAIDARQPHTPESTTPAVGPTSLTLTMGCDAAGTVIADFEVFGTPPPGVTVSNVMVNMTAVALTFSGPIPPGQYTCVRHIESGDEVCLGYLPGDVNNDGIAMTDTVDPADDDVQVLTDFLKIGVPELEIWQCDIDRSSVCTVLDIGREIDVLNGADMFQPWLNVDIGVCPSLPAIGACCVGEACSVLNEDECALASGSFRGAETGCSADPFICAPLGACCQDSTCTLKAQENCESAAGEYHGDNTECTAELCIPLGACCNNGLCTEETAADCGLAGDVYAGDGTTCDGATCDTGACCTCDCTNTLRAQCDETIAVFHEGETCAQIGTCELDLASSNPPSCAIDARQYQDPDMLQIVIDPKEDPIPLYFGMDHLPLTMTCDAAGLTEDDFFLYEEPEQQGFGLDHIPPPDGTTVNVVFTELLMPSTYVCVEFDPTHSTKCVGFLPGDVDQSRKSEAADTLVLIDHLEGDLAEPLGPWQCDADRSGVCTPLDVLRHMDILVGANGSTWWINAQINPCPFE